MVPSLDLTVEKFDLLCAAINSLDEKQLKQSIDLFEPFPSVIHTGDVPLGIATLDAGSHTLSITLKGKNSRSTDYLVGMDWIKLTPAPAGSFPDRRDLRNRK
jgi:D-arabinan exo alpha-(1,3)/(1,5)-arabinofuranosidase (non-reducing end)